MESQGEIAPQAQGSPQQGLQQQPSEIEQAAIEAHAEALRAQGLRVDSAVLDAAYAEPIASTRRITVGALNIVLAGETTEGSGVPSEILEKLPTMTYIAAKTSQENRKSNIKDGEAHQKLDAKNNSIVPQMHANDEGDTIEINIPGLQVSDGDEQGSEDTDGQQNGQQAGDQNCERTCEICQSEYETADNVMVLPCGHFYHQLCIGRWLSKHTTCPTCRFEICPSDKAPARNVMITRTTTIEWVPVTQWIPATTTTVEVVNDPASDFETVTTTTSRPVMRRLPSSPDVRSASTPEHSPLSAAPVALGQAIMAARPRNSPHVPSSAPAASSPLLAGHASGTRTSPVPSPLLPPARHSPPGQGVRGPQFQGLDVVNSSGGQDGAAVSFGPFPPRASPHLSPSAMQLSPPAFGAGPAYSPTGSRAARQPPGPGRQGQQQVYALSAFDPFGRGGAAAGVSGPGQQSMVPLNFAAPPAGYSFEVMTGRQAGPAAPPPQRPLPSPPQQPQQQHSPLVPRGRPRGQS